MQQTQFVRLVPLALAAISLNSACAIGGNAGRPDGHPTSSAALSQAVSVKAPNQAVSAPLPPRQTWKDALRARNYRLALTLLEALPDAQGNTPKLRVARGYAALQTGKYTVATQALGGLETTLPLIAKDLQRWYAQAALEVGPFDQAADYFAQSPKVRDLISAAQGYERAGKMKTARKFADRAVKLAERTRRRSDEADARRTRAHIAEKTGKIRVAATDYNWLVRKRASDPRVRDAISALDRLKGRLKIHQRLNALARSSTNANIAQTLTRIDALAKRHASKAGLLAFYRAKALYRVRDYPKARDAFDRAAKLASGHRAEARYYAARCAARLGENSDALKRFRNVMVRHKKSGWAERASYRRALLLSQLGRHREAAVALARYLSRFGKTKDAIWARYHHALALLRSGKAKQAYKAFRTLRQKASKRQFRAQLQHLEALAAHRSGRKTIAKNLWLELVREQPLTWAAFTAYARLKAIDHKPLPPMIKAAASSTSSPLSVKLPPTAAFFHDIGMDDAAEREIMRQEQSIGKQYPDREAEALCDIYGLLNIAVRRYQVGTRSVSLAQLMRAPSSSDNWTWRCVYPQPYQTIVNREAKRYQVSPALVHAVMRQESAFKPHALSPANASGLMQLIPTTAAQAAKESGLDIKGKDSRRPDINLALGTYYLGKLLRTFDGSVPVALASYNAGPHAAARWLAAQDRYDIDLWVASIPYHETRHYVARVMGNYLRYKWLAEGTQNMHPLSLEIAGKPTIGDDAY